MKDVGGRGAGSVIQAMAVRKCFLPMSSLTCKHSCLDDLGGSWLENSNAYAISVWASWSFNQYGGEEEEDQPIPWDLEGRLKLGKIPNFDFIFLRAYFPYNDV